MPKLGKRARAAKSGWANKSVKLAKSKSARESRKHKQWSDESMVHAMTAVKDGQMGVNRAAQQFGVPKTTLKDRLSGRVQHGRVSGPEPYLNKEEEQELVDFLIQMAKLGYGKTKKDVLSIVKRTVESKGITKKFNGEGWWTRFKQRNPSLRLRVADPLAMVRSVCTHKEVIDEYFKLLEQTLDTLGLKNIPTQIYNMDETGVPLDAKQLKRIAPKGMKKVHGRSSGNKTQITVVACGNAAGSMIPPFVIFKGERLNYELTKGEVPETRYGMSENGWIDSELFFHWLNTHFVRHIPPTRPVLLLLDGHSTHFTPEALKESKTKGIEVLALPPHTTHQAQPLDVSFFKSLKSHWSSVCHDYLSENLGHVVTKFQFSSLFSKAWYLAIKPQTIMNGFRKTGIYPLDKNALTTTESLSSSSDTGDQSNETMDTEAMDTDISPAGTTDTFTDEQIALFQERYENGYDLLFDKEYISWLTLNHPDSLLTHTVVHDDFGALIDSDLESLVASPVHPEGVGAPVDSLSDSESVDVDHDVTQDESVDVDHDVTQDEPYLNKSPSTSAVPLTSTPVSSKGKLPISVTPVTPTSTKSVSFPESLSKSLETTRKLHTSVSNFLAFPVEAVSKKSKSRKGAKVLTSLESLALLEEKARQKKEEEEAKEQRKRDREQKKIQREEEKRIKAEERAKKAEVRLKLAEAKKMEKEQIKLRKIGKKVKVKVTQKLISNGGNTDQGVQVGEVSSNECAICLGAYEDDVQDGKLMYGWVECTHSECKKWMHESCLQKDPGDEDLLVCGVCKSVFC